MPILWNQCLAQLETMLSDKDLNTWIRPLNAVMRDNILHLQAPNNFVQTWVKKNYLKQIDAYCRELDQDFKAVTIIIGGESKYPDKLVMPVTAGSEPTSATNIHAINPHEDADIPCIAPNLDPNYTFAHFVEGKSNNIARAAAQQIAKNPGNVYNPLFIYGGVGLGKTHLMHAVGHEILQQNPKARVAYLHSERFVGDMISAIQHNTMSNFKRIYRNIDTLLVDDIQFFAGKTRSQEEFFHTFNALMEQKQQIILTCDRYPKEVDGLEDRLKSRFGWGLSVAIEPPELEERVAILQSKAEQSQINMPTEVAFYIAKHIRSNVRDLEGAMRQVIANSSFTNVNISLEFAQKVLRDLVASHEKSITIDNIQKTVANYYKIRTSDLSSSSRARAVARPRQIAMSLAKELTNHSLPAIGDAFGGRDHTTVLHAIKQVNKLRIEDNRIEEDYKNLLRNLNS